MGNYDFVYLSSKERQFNNKVLIPYEYNVTKTSVPTRLQGSSESSIDYIIIDHLNLEDLRTGTLKLPSEQLETKQLTIGILHQKLKLKLNHSTKFFNKKFSTNAHTTNIVCVVF